MFALLLTRKIIIVKSDRTKMDMTNALVIIIVWVISNALALGNIKTNALIIVMVRANIKIYRNDYYYYYYSQCYNYSFSYRRYYNNNK